MQALICENVSVLVKRYIRCRFAYVEKQTNLDPEYVQSKDFSGIIVYKPASFWVIEVLLWLLTLFLFLMFNTLHF